MGEFNSDDLFIIGNWNEKVGSQDTPEITGKFVFGVRNEAEQRLIEFCQENGLVIANTLLNNTSDNSTYGHHQMVNNKIRLIISFAAKYGKSLYTQQKQEQELTGSDHELLIAKFRLKLKKVGKTTRPFRCDLNQIPYDYTVA